MIPFSRRKANSGREDLLPGRSLTEAGRCKRGEPKPKTRSSDAWQVEQSFRGC